MGSNAKRTANRRRTSDVYSFTTTQNDTYWPRVLDEANPNVNFILVAEKSSEHDSYLANLFIRLNVFGLADTYPDLQIAGKTLLEGREHAIQQADDSEWVQVMILGFPEVVKAKLETIRQQIRSINNKLSGKTLKVSVESF